MRIFPAVAAVVVLASGASAQVDTAWVRNLSGPVQGNHSGNSIWAMPDGGAVVTGSLMASNNKSDITVTRISPTGDALWTQTYNGSSNGPDVGRLVQSDASGNVYVAGSFQTASSVRGIVLLKYTPEGDMLWARAMALGDSTVDDSVTAMCIDYDGNIILTGMTDLFQWWGELFVRKFDPLGDVLWYRTYDYYAYLSTMDIPRAIACDVENNIYVTGGAQTPDWDYLTIKYTPIGNRRWVRIFDSPWHDDEVASAIALDAKGAVYITGTSLGQFGSEDYLTLKYDSLGVVQWTRRYIGPANGADRAVGIGVDDAGAIYVGGQTESFFSFEDFHIIKYDTASIPVWDRQYTGPGFSVEVPNSFQVTPAGVTYISGASGQGSSSWEFATVSFDSAGFLRWERRYGASMNDSAASMHLDESGNVFVTGTGSQTSASDVITAIKYSPCGPPVAVNPPVPSTTTPCAGEEFTLTWATSPGAITYELFEDGAYVSSGPDTFKTLIRSNGSFTYTVRARHPACGVSGYSGVGGQISVQCSCHGDSNCDGEINIIDVTSTINEAFRGVSMPPDAGCVNSIRSDVDCDCAVSITDVVRVIDVAFRGAAATTAFCIPCLSACP